MTRHDIIPLKITDCEELISVSFAFLPVLQIHQRFTKKVFCFDGCHVKDGRKKNKMQILTCEIVDSTEANLVLGCCVGFSENAENYESLIDCIQFCGLNLNRGEFIMIQRIQNVEMFSFKRMNELQR